MTIDLKQFHDVFFEEAEEHLSTIELLLLNLDLTNPDPEDINSIFRAAHSIKGGANMFGFSEISSVTHAMETVLDSVRRGILSITGEIIDAVLSGNDVARGALTVQRSGGDVDAASAQAITSQLEKISSAKSVVPAAGTAPAEHIPEGTSDGEGQAEAAVSGEQPVESADFGFFEENLPGQVDAGKATTRSDAHASASETLSIRVSTKKIDRLIDLVGELVIGHSILRLEQEVRMNNSSDVLALDLVNVDRNLRDLQEAALAIRMIPIAFVFDRFPRMVRDLSQRFGKKVELTMVGEATELDKALIEGIVDPLTHLIRNAIDHGIEMPDVRAAAGKTESGKITLSAGHQGGSIVIEVIDDGRGLSRDDILAVARKRGIAVSDSMSDAQVWQLIFEPGFSTAGQITDISGRGVGMDVVRRNIHKMGGRVEVRTMLNAGTSISIKLPLTLAILEGMSVRVGQEIFIIPLSHIAESLQPAAVPVSSMANRGQVVAVRGEYLPLISLAETFNLPGDAQCYDDGILVILEAEGGRTALFLDELMGQHQVVIKSLETNYRNVPGISGATIMGNGRVALILDVAHIVGICHNRIDKVA
ncbi:fused chemotactic sensory histidine kinase in two-component regulatory system with CheB and CheY: sensory histidine kinase; signal sensing protein [Georgfuchsia toluolica]|uniref:Chemotaxis protein CheA n=1 Tax=Georgfuchsia toluolica TaxID=424218 RepID=A0A916J3L7_9PROT|nr:chemotaxis protein CheW [Georgfuchsia toluolica]CAG4882626.1 fused chemotactic sensory histidine kinase in two-component regulatory system with CheB and CheY: sensory histidine kinase; signal sensing protein [Georgfuchsia toluolica]